jgi:TonB family protein
MSQSQTPRIAERVGMAKGVGLEKETQKGRGMTSLRLFETGGVLIAQHTTSHPFETRPPRARDRRSRWPYDASVVLHVVALISVVSLARHRAQPPVPAGPLPNVASAVVLPRPDVDKSGHRRPSRTQRSRRVPAVIADEEPSKSAFDPPLPAGRRASLQGYGDPSEAGSLFRALPGFDGASAGGGGPTPPRIQEPLPIPDYPTDARTHRLQGVVVLEVMLDTFGKAHVRGVLSRPLGFGIEEAARNAAERLRFTPARQGDRSVDAIVQVRVTFTLTDDDETAVTGGA